MREYERKEMSRDFVFEVFVYRYYLQKTYTINDTFIPLLCKFHALKLEGGTRSIKCDDAGQVGTGDLKTGEFHKAVCTQ